MDYLRSCYTTTFRLYLGGVETLVPVRWYFTRPTAQTFPVHCFGSSVWTDWRYEPLEVAGEATRSKGLTNGFNWQYQGQCYVGDPQWFLTGNLPSRTSLIPAGLPTCCRDTFGPMRLACKSTFSRTGHSTASQALFSLGAQSKLGRQGAYISRVGLTLGASSFIQWNAPRAGRAASLLVCSCTYGAGLKGAATLDLLAGSAEGVGLAGDAVMTLAATSARGVGLAGDAVMTLAATSTSSADPAQAGDAVMVALAVSAWIAENTYSYAGIAVATLGAKSTAIKGVTSCSQCSGGAPSDWISSASGGTGSWAYANTSNDLAYVSGCTWRFGSGPGTNTMQLAYSASWALNLGPSGGGTAQYTISSFSCLGQNVFTLQSHVGGTGTPPGTITLSPKTS